MLNERGWNIALFQEHILSVEEGLVHSAADDPADARRTFLPRGVVKSESVKLITASDHPARYRINSLVLLWKLRHRCADPLILQTRSAH
jgi:hypothetical protein